MWERPIDWDGYTDPETGYDADDYEEWPEDGEGDLGPGIFSDGADLNDDAVLEELGNPGASE